MPSGDLLLRKLGNLHSPSPPRREKLREHSRFDRPVSREKVTTQQSGEQGSFNVLSWEREAPIPAPAIPGDLVLTVEKKLHRHEETDVQHDKNLQRSLPKGANPPALPRGGNTTSHYSGALYL